MTTDGGSLRIVLAIGQLGLGGTERQLTLLAQGLAAQGHEVTVLSLYDGGPLEGDLRDAGIAVHRLAFRTFRRSRWAALLFPVGLVQLLLLLRALRPDVVHAFLFHSYVVVCPLARLAGVPVVVAGRRSLSGFKRGRCWVLALERLSNRFTRHWVANSEAVAIDAISGEGLDPARVSVIPNALPDSFFLRSSPLPALDGPARVLTVANLRTVKGHEHWLRAAARVQESGHDLELHLVGEGPLLAGLRQLAAELSVPVVFHGRSRDVRAHLEHCHLFVLPSLEEGMSNALMEAVAAGVPCVATDVGGNAAVLGGLHTLARPGDVASLAQAVSRVLKAYAQGIQGASQQRDAMRAQWSVGALAHRHAKLYQSLLHSEQVAGTRR